MITKKRGFRFSDFRAIVLTGAKLVAVIVILAAAPWAWFELFTFGFDAFFSSNRLLYAFGYALIFWTAVCSIGIVPFIRAAYVRIPLVIAIITAYAADQMFL